MEKLEIIIVQGGMLSISDSTASSLAGPTICAILLGLVSMVFLATKKQNLQQGNMGFPDTAWPSAACRRKSSSVCLSLKGVEYDAGFAI